MTDYKQLCAELVDELEGWIAYGDEIDIANAHVLIDRAHAALAEPEPEEPTRRQLMMLADDMDMASVGDAAEYARAVLARWGNHPESPDSSLRPVPVSERLPGPEDCDGEGECYWFNPEGSGAWYQNTYQGNYSHWLPAHALPVPSHD